MASLERMQKRPANTESAAEQAWSAINEPIAAEPQTPLSGAAVIRISVSADSWVEIIDSTGKQLEKDLLRGGNDRSYQGSPPFDLMLGRASAVVVEFQGEAVDIAPHIRGDVARLTLGAAEPQNPRREPADPIDPRHARYSAGGHSLLAVPRNHDSRHYVGVRLRRNSHARPRED
jgi:hypothetical protein